VRPRSVLFCDWRRSCIQRSSFTSNLEATVRPETLLEIARRNDYPLPANTVEGLAELYRYRDFRHFIEVWVLTVRGALGALGADRLRHGICANDDSGLVREIAGRGTVLDICPLSNLRTGAVASLAEHPLPHLVAAGVHCSISTDDPVMFDTDLTRDYEAAASFGISPRAFYVAGVRGALCDNGTRARLRELGESFDWDRV
jgi:adenosine deaminase